MLKEIGEGAAFVFTAGGVVTMYTFAACVASGEPFPAWFLSAWYFYCSVVLIALTGLVVHLAMWFVRRRRRRLGMIRMRDGRFCYEKR